MTDPPGKLATEVPIFIVTKNFIIVLLGTSPVGKSTGTTKN